MFRERLKQQRQTFTPHEREQAAIAAAKLFTESTLFFANQKFAVYVANACELELTPIVQTLWETGKQVYLPCLTEGQDRQMQFKAFDKNTKLIPNRHHILEPATQKTFPATELEVVLLPLIGFDLQGFRIGTGGGYYDATFSFLQNNPRPLKPQLIGVGFEVQRIDQIPHDEWDVMLDGILTEQALRFF